MSKSKENIWEQIHSKRGWGRYPNEELVRFFGRNFFSLPKDKRKGIRILDVGCGQGSNLWFLSKEGFSVHGIDISASAIKKASALLREWGANAELREADARELPFESNFFDVAIDCASVQHCSYEDHKRVYEEVHRVLKKGGVFWSFHIAKGSWGYGTGTVIGHETFDSLREGPLADKGITCMLSDSDLRAVLSKQFAITGLEKCSLSFENRQKEIAHFIATAVKQ